MFKEGEKEERKVAELIATIMLGLATVLAAWSAFQAAKWSGRQAIAFSEAGAKRVLASTYATGADQRRALDANIFIAWAQAVASEERASELRAHGYQPKVGTLSNFFFRRFPPELERATKAWLATRPFRTRQAPATPFEMPEYRLPSSETAKRLFDQAEGRAADARLFNLRSDRYVALTILFATVLFLSGIATKVEGRLIRRVTLGLSLVILVGSVVVLLTFPVALH